MQPRSAYSTAIRPELMSPVALISSGRPANRRPRACAARKAESSAEVPVAQVGAAVGDAALALELAIGIEEAVGIDEEVGPVAAIVKTSASMRQLEVVVVEAVEQLEPDPDLLGVGRGRADQGRDAA